MSIGADNSVTQTGMSIPVVPPIAGTNGPAETPKLTPGSTQGNTPKMEAVIPYERPSWPTVGLTVCPRWPGEIALSADDERSAGEAFKMLHLGALADDVRNPTRRREPLNLPAWHRIDAA